MDTLYVSNFFIIVGGKQLIVSLFVVVGCRQLEVTEDLSEFKKGHNRRWTIEMLIPRKVARISIHQTMWILIFGL